MNGKWIFYRTTSGPAFEFCSAWRERKQSAADALSKWAQQQGADSFIPGSKGWAHGGWAINALSGKGAPPKGWRVSKKHTDDNRPMWVPDRRAAEGRALEKQMKEMEGLPFPDEFCTAFGFPHALEYRGNDTIQGFSSTAQYRSQTCQIGWVDGEFWVLLPDLAALIDDYEAKGYTVETPRWSAPDGLIPSTKAQYELAVAQRRVAQERKAA